MYLFSKLTHQQHVMSRFFHLFVSVPVPGNWKRPTSYITRVAPAADKAVVVPSLLP